MALRLAEKPVEPARKLFGTDGVRGVANVYPMTAEVMLQLGRALAYLIRNGNHRHRVVIGKDTRLSGYMLEQALAAGICSMGVDVLLVRPAADAGHRQHHHVDARRRRRGDLRLAQPLPGQRHQVLLRATASSCPTRSRRRSRSSSPATSIDHLRPTATSIGKAFRIDDAAGRYIVFLKNTFPRELTLDGLTIVVDCAHGAAYQVAPGGAGGARREGDRARESSPTARTSTAACGALHPENDGKAVVKTGRNLGIALDGDADRLIVVDENGDVVDGDAIMAICACELIAAQGAPEEDAGRHGDEQHGPRAVQSRRPAARWCARGSAIATSSRRCGAAATTSAASSPAT